LRLRRRVQLRRPDLLRHAAGLLLAGTGLLLAAAGLLLVACSALHRPRRDAAIPPPTPLRPGPEPPPADRRPGPTAQRRRHRPAPHAGQPHGLHLRTLGLPLTGDTTMRLRSPYALYEFAFAHNTASLTLLDAPGVPPGSLLLVSFDDPNTGLDQTYWP